MGDKEKHAIILIFHYFFKPFGSIEFVFLYSKIPKTQKTQSFHGIPILGLGFLGFWVYFGFYLTSLQFHFNLFFNKYKGLLAYLLLRASPL